MPTGATQQTASFEKRKAAFEGREWIAKEQGRTTQLQRSEEAAETASECWSAT